MYEENILLYTGNELFFYYKLSNLVKQIKKNNYTLVHLEIYGNFNENIKYFEYHLLPLKGQTIITGK